MPTLAARITFAAAFATALAAQCPPGAPMPLDVAIETTVPKEGPAHVRWQAGKDALAKGDLATARQHLEAALEFHPSSAPILFDRMLACRGEPDAQALWAERFVRAAANAQGRLTLDATQKKAIVGSGLDAALEQGKALTQLRAAAIAELARFVDRNKPSGTKNATRAVLVRWAAEVLLAAGHGAPTMLTGIGAAVDKTQRAFVPDHDVVLQGLARLMRQKPAAPPAPPTMERAIRSARILTGLRHQGAFKDLKGPLPYDTSGLADEAQELLDAHATTVAKGKVWTIEELEALTPEAAAAFTDAHDGWHDPGLALSRTGRYRIETICGRDTLLGAAKTIELHHARLAGHYGSDPFEKRQGIVRIVPEHGDLEADGAPYWWAGGFQSGDLTTVRFAWDRIPMLGRTLVHELSHRFDGVLRTFAGDWYGEGHAEWTSKHYDKTEDTTFRDDHLAIYTVAHTHYKGYGDKEKFTKLLDGKIEDYRDNYFAGYSLYAFLRSYPPGAPRYREALTPYERNARAGQKDPVGWFTKHFCDGKQGRPATLDAFVEEWNVFLRGCYEWNDDKKVGNEWVGKYAQIDSSEPGGSVFDPPTWSWARVRAEPWFGQDHAAAATLLLHEAGDVEATIAAGVWSLLVDGWRPDTSRALLAALGAGKSPDAAAAFAAIARRRFPSFEPRPGALLASNRAVQALLDALGARATTLATAGAPLAAAAAAAEHRDLASLCGVPAASLPTTTPTAALPRHLGDHGFSESDLTDYQDLRVQGLWYATPEGDVHVGRERPRDATGTMDRTAHHRDAFVHSASWHRPGAYVLRGRVHFTTSYVSGCLVFGHTRADRDLRLHFSTGDYDYAIGKAESAKDRGMLEISLTGLWERDGRMPASGRERALELPAEQTWFDYELHVNGPRVIVRVGGESVLEYAVHDGTPIEGFAGFAMSVGAIRVQQPTVQRLDHGSGPMGLDLAAQSTATLEDLLMLPVRGIPAAPHGTLVLWLPKGDTDDRAPGDFLGRALPSLAKMRTTPHEHPQPWVLAVPRNLPADDRKSALEQVQKPGDAPIQVVEHAIGAPFSGRYPWVLFVDGLGILRAAAPVNDPQLHSVVGRWSRFFRAR